MSPIYVPGKIVFDSGNRPAAIAGVAPTLDYRFARERREIEVVSLTDKLTYTGANGTFVGSDGFIQQATTNVPRFDHDPVTGESLGLLIEETRTNLLTYSEEFDDASYIGAAAGAAKPIRTPNQTTAPDGSLTADKINIAAVSAAGTFSLIYRPAAALSGSHTSSIYLRGAVGGEKVYLFYIAGGIYSNTLCTLTTEWQRFSVNFTGGTVSYWHLGVDLRTGSGQVAQSASTIYAWGAQLEEGTFPTSYIPTTSSTVTRTADSAIIDGTGVLTGTYTMIEKPASCAVESGGNIELQAGYTAERVMVFPAALSAQQITDIRSAM